MLDFNLTQGAEPFVTKYQLSLIDRDGGKEVKEKWLIQRGVGDIYNKQQQWKFITRVKPQHGIAVPLQPPTHPHTFRGRVFCFLPLPLDCNLPVHIHGHFILLSDRRGLWNKTERNNADRKQQWNTALLKAIAGSYAQLLLTLKADYKIESGVVNAKDVGKYYRTFPSWTAPQVWSFSPKSDAESTVETSNQGAAVTSTVPSQQGQASASSKVKLKKPAAPKNPEGVSSNISAQTPIPVPTNEWRTLAEEVFRTLAENNAPIVAVLHEKQRKESKTGMETIEWCPLKNKDQALQVHFISKTCTIQKSVLDKIGMKLTSTPYWVREHFRHVDCSIPSVTPEVSYKYYAEFHEKVLPAHQSFPCPIKYTSFKSMETFTVFLKYILKAIPHKSKQATVEEPPSQSDATAEDQPVHYPPLLVTAEGWLRYCNQEEDRVIKSAFSGLFQNCTRYFLHRDLFDLEVPEHFLLSTCQENESVCLKVIDECLSMAYSLMT